MTLKSRLLRTLTGALILPPTVSCAEPARMSQTTTPPKPAYATPRPEFIGMAHMQADGEIVMNLRAEGPAGLRGDGQVRVRPSEPNYASVREHLGPDLKAGGPEVPVRPFTPG